MKLSKKYGGLQFFAGGETWVLNNSITIDKSNPGGTSGIINFYQVGFTSGGVHWQYLGWDVLGSYTSDGSAGFGFSDTASQLGFNIKYTDGSGWTTPAARTITFDQPVTDSKLLTWLQANGVKQSSTPKVVETSLHFGADALDKSYLGADSLDRIYLGTDLLYQTLNEYSVTETLSNVTTIGTHPVKILEGKSLTLKYTADANYELPDSITVAGATSNWAKSTGTLVVSNPTGDVTITITAVRITYSITENLTNVTKTGTHPSVIAAGQTLVLNYTAATGYNLPDTVTVTGATSDWKQATGVLTITNPMGAVTITIAGVQPKLAAPTNLLLGDDTLTFDTVENAEQYEVFAGSNSIGTYTAPSKGYTVTISYSSLNPNVCFYSTDNGSTWIDGYVAGQSQLVLNNVEQIKFKGQYSSSGDYYAYISVPSLGVSISATSSSGAKYSDNFVLTQDLTDVTFGSGSD